MKKLFCATLILFVLLSCLTACNFTKNTSGEFAGEAEATPKVEEMMTALAESNTDAAKAFMHPEVVERSDNAIAQISNYLSGRGATAINMKSINVKTSTGTSGKTRQEQVAYQVTLNDDEVIYLNVTYLSNDSGTGFLSFQIVLGAI